VGAGFVEYLLILIVLKNELMSYYNVRVCMCVCVCVCVCAFVCYVCLKIIYGTHTQTKQTKQQQKKAIE